MTLELVSDPGRALVARADPPWGSGKPTGRTFIPAKNGLDIPDGCYAATGEGTEMEPEIFDGDVLIIDPNSRPVVGDLVIIYFNVRHQPLVKRIVSFDAGPDGRSIRGDELSPHRSYLFPKDKVQKVERVVASLPADEVIWEPHDAN